MALPSSGVLTLNDIQTEFGGTNPIDLSDYYRGGGLVPDTALNAGIPTSGVISVTDFYGSANTIALNFVNHGVASGNSGTINIGTARGTRMVHLSGYINNTSTIGGVTAVSINGSSAALIVPASSQRYGAWQAYAKVPAGTTATFSITDSIPGAPIFYVSTFDTVNSGAANTGSTNAASFTFNFTAANPGVCFWGGSTGSGTTNPPTVVTLSTNNPGGINYFYQVSAGASGPAAKGAYSLTSTTVNQTFSFSGPAKLGGHGAVASIFYAN